MEETHPMQAAAVGAGLNWDLIKEGAKRLLPVAELIAANTANTVDDELVKYLRLILPAL